MPKCQTLSLVSFAEITSAVNTSDYRSWFYCYSLILMFAQPAYSKYQANWIEFRVAKVPESGPVAIKPKEPTQRANEAKCRLWTLFAFGQQTKDPGNGWETGPPPPRRLPCNICVMKVWAWGFEEESSINLRTMCTGGNNSKKTLEKYTTMFYTRIRDWKH